MASTRNRAKQPAKTGVNSLSVADRMVSGLKRWASSLASNIIANIFAALVILVGGALISRWWGGAQHDCFPVDDPLFSHTRLVIAEIGKGYGADAEKWGADAWGARRPDINIQATKASFADKDGETGKPTGNMKWVFGQIRIAYRGPDGGYTHLQSMVGRELRDYHIFDNARLNCKFRVDWAFVEEPKPIKFDNPGAPLEESPEDGFIAIAIRTAPLDEKLPEGCQFG